MFGVLDEGGAIGIFPEGLSHDASHLARLKTGAARLAIGGAPADWGSPDHTVRVNAAAAELNVPNTSPPTAPSIVFFGLTAGASGRRPNARPV